MSEFLFAFAAGVLVTFAFLMGGVFVRWLRIRMGFKYGDEE